MLEEAELTRDHWWWRPGWAQGRSFYTWHITFAPDSPARQLVTRAAPALAKIPTMAPVTADGLHITLQGIGFTDEVDRSDVEDIVEAARPLLAAHAPFTLHAGPPIVDTETVQMPLADLTPLARIRDDLQTAIGEVWGAGNVPERANTFRPHLTLAYSTGIAPISEIRDQLDEDGLADAYTDDLVTEVALIQLNRDHLAYEWVDIVRVGLHAGG
ncbi:2'-5' RNA ligase family protein [Nocardia sp. NPDC004722]